MACHCQSYKLLHEPQTSRLSDNKVINLFLSLFEFKVSINLVNPTWKVKVLTRNSVPCQTLLLLEDLTKQVCLILKSPNNNIHFSPAREKISQWRWRCCRNERNTWKRRKKSYCGVMTHSLSILKLTNLSRRTLNSRIHKLSWCNITNILCACVYVHAWVVIVVFVLTRVVRSASESFPVSSILGANLEIGVSLRNPPYFWVCYPILS